MRYRVRIEREVSTGVQYEWRQVTDTGNEKDNGPTYEYVAKPGIHGHEWREVLDTTCEEESGFNFLAVIAAVFGFLPSPPYRGKATVEDVTHKKS